MFEDLLLDIHKPAQYIGGEFNVSKKDFNSAKVRVALGFADLYEVGMSNLGLRIIYAVMNNIDGVVCERFFSCEADLGARLRSTGKRLFSLESHKPLDEFDIVGFSLGSELNYTNVLNILDLAGIPLKASERDKQHPLVIGGGPCTLNPEPMHEFFDFFVIGEAEELSADLIKVYQLSGDDFKKGKISRYEFLLEFAKIEGVYVPSLYDAVYNENGKFVELVPKISAAPKIIKKRVVSNFDNAYFPCDWVVPYIQTIHDRVSVELMRGCPNRCRFCQARSQYYPLRFRRSETVLDLAARACNNSGYEELSLAGLSVGDYPGLDKLVAELSGLFKDRAIGLSLPSLKAKAILGNISNLIAKTKKTGLTFAPEAGTQKLRESLAKDFQEEEFFQAIEEAYKAGYQHLKLYFMIGLPNEDLSDLDGILDFCRRASEAKKKVSNSSALINASVNGLIPKPHTPLQWLAMDGIDELKAKAAYLRGRNKNKRLKLSFHNFEMAYLEGILSRGDRRLSEVILAAFKQGARFDAWADHFSLDIWRKAFKDTEVNPDEYLRPLDSSLPLPWDFIDVGVGKNYLLKEFNDSVSNFVIPVKTGI